MVDLKYLIQNELFIAADLLTVDRFVSYCKERGVNTSEKQLEQFEKLKLFFPVARIRRPLIKVKIEYTPARTGYYTHDVVKRGEKWDGDFIEQYAHFSFIREQGKDWMKRGLLWDPATRPFKPWKSFYDKKRHSDRIESYYSIFQVYSLWNLIRWTEGLHVRPEWWITKTPAEIEKTIGNILSIAQRVIEARQNGGIRGGEGPLVCQAIANRYYWFTQSDRRTIHTSLNSDYHDWNWDDYIRQWDAHAMLNVLGMTIDEIKNLYDLILMEAEYVDPLEQWQELVNFVALEKKKKLRNEALLAQDLYAMARMLNMFYKHLTGAELRPPDQPPEWSWDKVYGDGVTQNELLYLELLTNEFNLNPRPKLILVVEGDGEAKQFPRLAKELFGYTFPKLGIEVVKLGGVANFTGAKTVDKHGALKRFIDNYHFKQTIVFVVLDQEGRVANIKRRLVEATSDFYPQRRVTKDEYIHLWQKNIEFDNFTDDEIAQAMSEAAHHRYMFTPAEIADCRASFGGREGYTLSKLFQDKLTDRELDKLQLMEELANIIIVNGKNELDENGAPKRPLVALIDRIIELASMNHQPVDLELWKENQESGYFGDLIS